MSTNFFSILIAMLITSIIISFAVPGLTQQTTAIHQRLATHQLITALEAARLLAIQRQSLVELTPINYPNNTDFTKGYEIKINNEIIMTFPAVKTGYWTNNLPHHIIRFKPDGRVSGTFGQFNYCLNNQINSNMAIIINSMGRIRQSITKSSSESKSC